MGCWRRSSKRRRRRRRESGLRGGSGGRVWLAVSCFPRSSNAPGRKLGRRICHLNLSNYPLPVYYFHPILTLLSFRLGKYILVHASTCLASAVNSLQCSSTSEWPCPPPAQFPEAEPSCAVYQKVSGSHAPTRCTTSGPCAAHAYSDDPDPRAMTSPAFHQTFEYCKHNMKSSQIDFSEAAACCARQTLGR